MFDPVVLDASAWLSVLLREEGFLPIEKLLQNRTLLAPELIRYETANALLYAKRSGRLLLSKKEIRNYLDIIWGSPIEIVDMKIWWDSSVELVLRHDITFYDAAYVAIAAVLKFPILTMDQKIMKVAKLENIETVEIG